MIIPPKHVFFIGPRKTGTTSIYAALERADVRRPTGVKETFYFEREVIDFSDYERDFGINPRTPFIEVSPSYFTSDIALNNILQRFPGAKIVITLRNPVARTISALQHVDRIWGTEVISLPADQLVQNKHFRNAVSTSNYEFHIRKWAEHFPGQVGVIRQDDSGNYTADAIKSLAAFIGIEIPYGVVHEERRNPAREARSKTMVKAARRLKKQLEQRGYRRAIRALKKLNPLIFKKARAVSPEVIEVLKTSLGADMAYYSTMPYWKVL